MDELEQAIGRMKARWMTGGLTRDLAPSNWRSVIDDVSEPEAERRLAALVGQATRVALKPAAPATLEPRADLPLLSSATLPDLHRPRFRRLMERLKSDRKEQCAVLHLMATRGMSAHPADWMPVARDESADNNLLPALYAPWVAWQLSRDMASAEGDLTEETWDTYFPAERRDRLIKLRATSPALARALIEEKASNETADQRLRLIEIIGNNLSADDAPYLETLVASDRSGKVKDLASRFLARLGHGTTDEERVVELADFLKIGKRGALNRQPVIKAPRLKTAAQRRRRAELFEHVSLIDLAGVLELSVDAVVEQWDYASDTLTINGFFSMLAASAPDHLVEPALIMWADAARPPPDALPELLYRLPPVQRSDIVTRMLQSADFPLSLASACMHHTPSCLPFDRLVDTDQFTSLLQSLREVATTEPSAQRTRKENEAADDVFQLGLLLDRNGATSAIEAICATGVMPADPQLDLLHFNASLEPLNEPGDHNP